ncbi:MAG: addiction module protein [Betaproteobacteria bacterium]|nr:addiction module protein [Betaproteobacteria bacterium]
MGSATLAKIRRDAMTLPEPERAELANSLMASLDGIADQDAASDWEAEILRRLSEIDAGTAELIDRETFRQRMKERIGKS